MIRHALLAGTLLLLAGSGPAPAQWTQWGGPQRDFTVESEGVSLESPPRQVWRRDLGEGESALLVDEGIAYTMFRAGGQEVAVALDAATGETLWERAYDAPIPDGMYVKHGDGPHGTPLLAGGRLFTFGIAGRLHALDRDTGRVLWSHDVMKEYGGRAPDCGYGSSPLAHDDLVIVQVGGPDHAVMAFRQKDGAVAWQSGSSRPGYAAPTLIDVDGQEQAVVFLHGQVAGFDPGSGELLWSHPHETSYGVNASVPVWGDDGILAISSAYDNGSRGLRLSRSGDETRVEEVWAQKGLEVHFTNVIRIGDHLYATSGDFGPTLLVAVHAATGEIAWRERDIARRAGLLRIGPRDLLILDETGKLVLAEVTPEKVTVKAEHRLLEGRVWAPPTLVGRRLYVRDRESAFAFDLGS